MAHDKDVTYPGVWGLGDSDCSLSGSRSMMYRAPDYSDQRTRHASCLKLRPCKTPICWPPPTRVARSTPPALPTPLTPRRRRRRRIRRAVDAYVQILGGYFTNRAEEALYRASLLSQQFIEEGLGPEEIIAVHAEAVEIATRGSGYRERARASTDALQFLLEMMIAYGVQYRAYLDLRLREREHETEARLSLERQRDGGCRAVRAREGRDPRHDLARAPDADHRRAWQHRSGAAQPGAATTRAALARG